MVPAPDNHRLTRTSEELQLSDRQPLDPQDHRLWVARLQAAHAAALSRHGGGQPGARLDSARATAPPPRYASVWHARG